MRVALKPQSTTSTSLRGSVGGKFECLTDAASIVVNNNKESRVSDPYANYSTHRESHWSASRAPIQCSVFIPDKISVFVFKVKKCSGAAGL